MRMKMLREQVRQLQREAKPIPRKMTKKRLVNHQLKEAKEEQQKHN
jgi:hypothetical protein